jgi:carbon storage regulator
MLVLTRKLNDAITIGTEGITVKIVDVRGNRVRLGIEAPQEVRIERSEVHAADARCHEPTELVGT